MSVIGQELERSPAVAGCNAVTLSPSVEAAVQVLRLAFSLDHVTFQVAKSIAGCFDAPYVKSTYPAEWLTRYLLRGYVNIDPVVKEGFSRRLPFDWSSLELSPPARRLMADAQAFGIGTNGYSIPVVDRQGRRSLLSVTSSIPGAQWPVFLKSNSTKLAEIAHKLHRKAIIEIYGEEDKFPHLSPREIECLRWTARGKDYRAIAAILDLSANTVRAYLKSVRHKLDCTTLSQAVAKAIHLRIISL
jgi:LuxR family transcriptional regulator, quorum-sensing system regulator CinR